MLEYKSLKATPIGIEDRTVSGIFCVHGHLDDGDGWYSRGDISHPGLFGDFTDNGRKRAVFLWQHQSGAPPIATIDRLEDIAAIDLPAAVKLYAPDATGGVLVTRTYLDSPRANEVLGALKAGAITEMSYAYETTEWSYEKQDDDDYRPPIRNLYKAILFDVSDVNHGMNDATSADGTKDRTPVEQLGAAKAAMRSVHAFIDRRRKEGRVLSSANYSALKQLADDLDASIATLRSLLESAEPKQQIDARRLLLDYQRTLAQLQGVRL